MLKKVKCTKCGYETFHIIKIKYCRKCGGKLEPKEEKKKW